MNVIVTGGFGFIGKNLVKCLINTENVKKIIVIDNLVTSDPFDFGSDKVTYNVKCIADFVINDFEKIDVIYHLASVANPVIYKDDFNNVYKPNVIGTELMLKLVKRDNCKLIYFSTSEIYGDTLNIDKSISNLKEDTMQVHYGLTSRSSYHVSKMMGEELVHNHYRQGYNVRIVRLFNVYGPDMDVKNTGYGRVIPNFINSVNTNEDIMVFGDGTQIRSFLWIDDCIEALILLMNEKENELIYNIGNPEPTSIIDLANSIISLSCKTIDIKFSAKDFDEPVVRVPNINLIKDKLGWKPSVSLIEGLGLLLNVK